MKMAADQIRESAKGFTVITPETAAGMMALGAEIALNALQSRLFERGLATSVPVIELMNDVLAQQNALSAMGGKP